MEHRKMIYEGVESYRLSLTQTAPEGAMFVQYSGSPFAPPEVFVLVADESVPATRGWKSCRLGEACRAVRDSLDCAQALPLDQPKMHYEGHNSRAWIPLDPDPATVEEWQREIDGRWGTSEYNAAFRADPRPQRDLEHAMVHVGIASGEFFRVIDKLSHQDQVVADAERQGFANRLADAYFSLLRMAQKYPSGPIDLQDACVARLAEKFPPRST